MAGEQKTQQQKQQEQQEPTPAEITKKAKEKVKNAYKDPSKFDRAMPLAQQLYGDKKGFIDPDKPRLKQIRDMADLNEFLRSTSPLGDMQSAASNMLYGLNHAGVDTYVGSNRDSYGYTFFTRPILNLGNFNLRGDRKMYSLLTQDKYSVHRWARCTLDPRLQRSAYINKYGLGNQDPTSPNPKRNTVWEGAGMSERGVLSSEATSASTRQIMKKFELKTANIFDIDPISCPLVDPNMAFIPILTNSLKSMSGWQDVIVNSYVSKAGLRQEQWGMVDSHMDLYGTFDLECTFENMRDEPLILLFETWLRYMANVFEGTFSPYLDFVIENELDYNTRIYRLVMDETKLFVKKISACGAAYPVNVPNGKFFDFEKGSKYNNNSKDINIRFTCFGAMYNDDILVPEFNLTTAMFNPDLYPYVIAGKTPKEHVEIPINLLHLFNFHGYPIIDEDTLQLKWFVNKNSKKYKEIVKIYGSEANPTTPSNAVMYRV